MAVLVAYDGDEAGQQAAVDASRKIALWFESWATPLNEGPTAQALATAQAEYDRLVWRYSVLAAADEASQDALWHEAMTEAALWVDEVAAYLVDLHEASLTQVDKQYLDATNVDEYVESTKPHKVLEDIASFDLQAVKARTNIVTLAEADTTLRPQGTGKFKGICQNPDHIDSKPSMWIYAETNSYFCFACRAGGDVLDYMKMTGRPWR